MFVKWSGYTSRFNSWIPASDVINTKIEREKKLAAAKFTAK